MNITMKLAIETKNDNLDFLKYVFFNYTNVHHIEKPFQT